MIAVLTPTFNRLQAIFSGCQPAAPVPPADDPFPLAHPDVPLPTWVAADPVAQKYRTLLGALRWA